MLNDDAIMMQAELEECAKELSQRLRRLTREIKELSQRAVGRDLDADPFVASVNEWRKSFSATNGWLDITKLYANYSDWMEGRGRPPVSLRRFCMIMHKADGVLSRKHPKTRRNQVWVP